MKEKTEQTAAAGPDDAGPLMTRERLLVFLNDEVGVPISESTLAKMCAPTCGKGPPVEAWWGMRPLYSRVTARTWALELLKARRSRLPLEARSGAKPKASTKESQWVVLAAAEKIQALAGG